MYKLKRVIVWIRRMRHSRGFGVQSPYDYRFIRYVINEHWPYYAYDELAKSVAGLDRKTRKLCRLYFRIANWLQPDVMTDYEPVTDAYRRYMETGCRRARRASGYSCRRRTASRTSTPRRERVFAISIFSSVFKVTPGDYTSG